MTTTTYADLDLVDSFPYFVNKRLDKTPIDYCSLHETRSSQRDRDLEATPPECFKGINWADNEQITMNAHSLGQF